MQFSRAAECELGFDSECELHNSGILISAYATTYLFAGRVKRAGIGR
jgi:hypothetical protein